MWVRGKLLAQEMVGACDKLWRNAVVSSSRVPLARLESIVAELEMAIPSGTVARQFNLKVSLSVPDGRGGAVSGPPQMGRRLSFFTDSATGKVLDRRSLLDESGNLKGDVDPGKGIADMLMGDGWVPTKVSLTNQGIHTSRLDLSD